MEKLQNKVIQLGIERGYLPRNAGDNSLEKFDIQYLRFIEEIGEASRELRLKNEDAFKIEVGDALVLYTNCCYILDEYLVGFDGLSNSLNLSFCTLEKLIKMHAWASNTIEFKEECLRLAYDKIVNRGGMLIGRDWFKPSDKEYQEAKLNELEEVYTSYLKKSNSSVAELQELYFKLQKIDDSSLDDDSISRIVFLETSVYGMLKAI